MTFEILVKTLLNLTKLQSSEMNITQIYQQLSARMWFHHQQLQLAHFSAAVTWLVTSCPSTSGQLYHFPPIPQFVLRLALLGSQSATSESWSWNSRGKGKHNRIFWQRC